MIYLHFYSHMDSDSRSLLLFCSLMVVFASSAVAAAHSSSNTWLFLAPPRVCACAQTHVLGIGWLGKYLVTINNERVYCGCLPPSTGVRGELKPITIPVPKDLQYLCRSASPSCNVWLKDQISEKKRNNSCIVQTRSLCHITNTDILHLMQPVDFSQLQN